MTEREFVYWLQGFLEIANPEKIGATKIQIIRDHLDLVLKKVTPNRRESSPSGMSLGEQLSFELSRPRTLCSNGQDVYAAEGLVEPISYASC